MAEDLPALESQRGLTVADPADRPTLPLPSAQLLLHRFGPEAEFEGRLVGALERIENLDASKRRRATERALGGDRGAAVCSLSTELDRGESMAVVLLEHVWANALEDAVARTGGRPVTSELVEATAPAELSAEST
jgi:hypothetical protein